MENKWDGWGATEKVQAMNPGTTGWEFMAKSPNLLSFSFFISKSNNFYLTRLLRRVRRQHRWKKRHCVVCRPKIHSSQFLFSTTVLSSHWFIMLYNFSWVDRVSPGIRDRDQLLQIPKLSIIHRKFPVNVNWLIESYVLKTFINTQKIRRPTFSFTQPHKSFTVFLQPFQRVSTVNFQLSVSVGTGIAWIMKPTNNPYI